MSSDGFVLSSPLSRLNNRRRKQILDVLLSNRNQMRYVRSGILWLISTVDPASIFGLLTSHIRQVPKYKLYDNLTRTGNLWVPISWRGGLLVESEGKVYILTVTVLLPSLPPVCPEENIIRWLCPVSRALEVVMIISLNYCQLCQTLTKYENIKQSVASLTSQNSRDGMIPSNWIVNWWNEIQFRFFAERRNYLVT